MSVDSVTPRLDYESIFLSLTLSVCLYVILYVCLSRCSFKLLLFCFFMESNHFLAISSPCGTLQNCFSSIFDLGPVNPKIYSPKFGTKSPTSRLVWQIDQRCLGLLGDFRGWPIQWNHAKCCGPTLVAMATKFLQIWAIFQKIAYTSTR